jgi:hypothetical protein
LLVQDLRFSLSEENFAVRLEVFDSLVCNTILDEPLGPALERMVEGYASDPQTIHALKVLAAQLWLLIDRLEKAA